MSYPADLGGNFASDVHRRVQAALPNPDENHASVDEVLARTELDDFLDLDLNELEDVLADLEADGDATQTKNGWKNTKAGYEALTGRIASDGGRNYDK